MKLYLTTLVMFVVFLSGLYSQVGIETVTTEYCSESSKGSISVTLIPKNPTSFSPPFLVEYHNLDTDYYGELIAGNQFVIQDLDAGQYELIIHLDDETLLSTDCPVIENPNSVDVLSVEHSCNNDGSITI